MGKGEIMKGDKKVIAYLNKALKNELTAINQYFLHARMLKNWGITRMTLTRNKKSTDRLKHGDGLIDLIIYIKGLQMLRELARLRTGENKKRVMEYEPRLEMKGATRRRKTSVHAET